MTKKKIEKARVWRWGAIACSGVMAIVLAVVISQPAPKLDHGGRTLVLGAVDRPVQYDVSLIKVSLPPSKTTPGKQRLTYVVTVKNNGLTPINVDPLTQMTIANESELRVSATPVYQKNIVLGGQVAPGSYHSDTVDFDLPKDMIAKTFIYQLSSNDPPIKLSL